MPTLFLHTASPSSTSVALFVNDALAEWKIWPAQQNESETLLPNVQSLLKAHHLSADDIERLVVCVGPGGFTSTRVGVSAANAWSFAKQIPLAGVSLFDLYEGFNGVVMVSANPREAWIQYPGKDPDLVQRDDIDYQGGFRCTGELSEDWIDFLCKQGCTFIEQQAVMPLFAGLDFQNEPLKPWYYKDPNITWSKKHKLT